MTMVSDGDKPPDHSDAVKCQCGSPVWPKYDGQTHRDCDNCGTRVIFEEWIREEYGSDPPPKFAMEGPTPAWEKESDDQDDYDDGKQSSLSDYD